MSAANFAIDDSTCSVYISTRLRHDGATVARRVSGDAGGIREHMPRASRACWTVDGLVWSGLISSRMRRRQRRTGWGAAPSAAGRAAAPAAACSTRARAPGCAAAARCAGGSGPALAGGVVGRENAWGERPIGWRRLRQQRGTQARERQIGAEAAQLSRWISSAVDGQSSSRGMQPRGMQLQGKVCGIPRAAAARAS